MQRDPSARTYIYSALVLMAIGWGGLMHIKGTCVNPDGTRCPGYPDLKVLAVARLIHPTAELRVAGGREYHLRSMQPMALFIVNSMFVNGYLTEGGAPPDEAFRMIEDAGFEVVEQGAAAAHV